MYYITSLAKFGNCCSMVWAHRQGQWKGKYFSLSFSEEVAKKKLHGIFAGKKGIRCYEAKIEPSQSSICTAQVVLNASVAQLAAIQYVPSELRCAVHIEDCQGWWLSDCRGSMAEHWRLKPEVSWVRLPATAGLFTFLYFRLITSDFFIIQPYKLTTRAEQVQLINEIRKGHIQIMVQPMAPSNSHTFTIF